jgi:hypothetical protein
MGGPGRLYLLDLLGFAFGDAIVQYTVPMRPEEKRNALQRRSFATPEVRSSTPDPHS